MTQPQLWATTVLPPPGGPTLLGLEGVCTSVPTPYVPEQHARQEERWRSSQDWGSSLSSAPVTPRSPGKSPDLSVPAHNGHQLGPQHVCEPWGAPSRRRDSALGRMWAWPRCLPGRSLRPDPPPPQGRPAGPALPGDTWDHQLTWVPHNWDCASHRVQARNCLRDGASSTRRLEATGCGTGCSRGRVGRGPHDARTRYKYLQVSLRKKLSIRSSLDLSMTWCSVA